jgi:signal transduction histidine kinase
MKNQVRYALQIALVAVVYFFAAKLALALAIPPGYATSVWPASGIALAALLLSGWRLAPGIWLGAACANFTIQFSFPVACAIATGNTAEALVAAALVQRFIGRHGRFERGEDVVRFVGIAVAAGAVAATAASLTLGLGGFVPWQSTGYHWWTWWQGDVAGIIIVTPLVLAWARPQRAGWTADRGPELVMFAILLLLAASASFAWPYGSSLPFFFLLLPFMIWAAFRFTQTEVTTAAVLVCGIAVWQTVGGRGPFATENTNLSLLLLQAFMCTIAVMGLVLSAVLEERRRAAERLRQAHDELEQFVYVAAHDLQEPLRSVLNFTDMLGRRGDRLDPESREFLGFIESGVGRMRRILSDLLAFSQVDRRAGEPGEVDCERALDNVLEGLRAAIDESGAAVTRDPLPTVTGVATLIELVLQNLIVNAIKFRGERPLRIHVSARREGAEWVFSVRDNGIGIARRHFDTVFEMFQRLNASERYTGTGIGLTICRKIVERHGGRIWLESEEGAGTTFHFTVPA